MSRAGPLPRLAGPVQVPRAAHPHVRAQDEVSAEPDEQVLAHRLAPLDQCVRVIGASSCTRARWARPVSKRTTRAPASARWSAAAALKMVSPSGIQDLFVARVRSRPRAAITSRRFTESGRTLPRMRARNSRENRDVMPSASARAAAARRWSRQSPARGGKVASGLAAAGSAVHFGDQPASTLCRIIVGDAHQLAGQGTADTATVRLFLGERGQQLAVAARNPGGEPGHRPATTRAPADRDARSDSAPGQSGHGTSAP